MSNIIVINNIVVSSDELQNMHSGYQINPESGEDAILDRVGSIFAKALEGLLVVIASIFDTIFQTNNGIVEIGKSNQALIALDETIAPPMPPVSFPPLLDGNAQIPQVQLTPEVTITPSAPPAEVELSNSSSSIPTPFLEAYWECWNMANATDFCSQLATIPVGNGPGKVNVVDISFGDYTFTRDQSGNINSIGFVNSQTMANGSTFDMNALKQAVQTIQAQGGKVKLSLGGATFSMSKVVTDDASTLKLAQDIADAVNAAGLDGVDFDIEDGGVTGDRQLLVYHKLSQLLPGKLLSFTMPANGELYEPYATVISKGSQYFTSINVMAYDYYWSGYDPATEFAKLQQMGVNPSQIVWGLMPGHADDPNEYVTTDAASKAAQFVKQNNLGGIMIWDLNRDTNHRTGQNGQDNVYETGQPDGSYIDAISAALQGQ